MQVVSRSRQTFRHSINFSKQKYNSKMCLLLASTCQNYVTKRKAASFHLLRAKSSIYNHIPIITALIYTSA